MSVSVGFGYACGITSDQSVFCWRLNPDTSLGSRWPSQPPDGSFTQVSAGQDHACGVRTDGSAVCWGEESRGQTRVPGGRTFVAVSVYGGASCGLRPDGEVDCWGSKGWPDGPFSAIAGVPENGCGLKEGGTLVCWRDGYFSENLSPDGSFASVSVGRGHTCGIKTDGQLVCWGSNEYGQSISMDGSFVSVSVSVSRGSGFTCGVKTDGSLVCWGGYNFFVGEPEICRADGSGQVECEDLELGDLTHPGGSFDSISVSYDAFCGLKTDKWRTRSAASKDRSGYIICRTINNSWVVRPPAGSLSSLSYSYNSVCGIKEDLGSVDRMLGSRRAKHRAVGCAVGQLDCWSWETEHRAVVPRTIRGSDGLGPVRVAPVWVT